ncbi:hypothetical protein Pfo_012651 [Paulownia fortunei]|nr:hypothetical protein Pfo_012651 [Paulownia fortunei]
MSNNEKIKHDENIHIFQLNDMTRAIATTCSSESLSDCEMAIRAVTESWLNSRGGTIIETSLSQASVIQGIMEVLYVSTDDEILELAISILAELATRSEMNRQCILNSDPQLDVSVRLLRSSSLFLEAAALLYLVKPKAKQMISMEWIPLVLQSKDTIISLLVLGSKQMLMGIALALLTELLCLSRRNQRIESLTGLINGWDCLNTMHILLFHLQRARPEERPIIAHGDRIYAIVKALDCWVFDEKIQELSARSLLILGGHFSYNGEPEVERWLLRKAGLSENIENSLCGKDISIDGHLNLNEEDKTTENWQRKAAIVLLTSGNRRLLAASLMTVCWMSSGLHSLGDTDLQLAACSILVPQLIECLNDNTNLEEKILASFSLYSLTKGTDYFSRLYRLEKEVLGCLRKLSRVTWTAKELISLVTSNLSDPFP